jgi:hypothetical protein
MQGIPLVLLSWKPLVRNSLRGFAKVRIGRAMIVHDVAVHNSGGRRWAQLPAKPQVDASGVAKRDDRGKILYTPLVEWADRETADRFSESVISAVEELNPGATAADAA